MGGISGWPIQLRAQTQNHHRETSDNGKKGIISEDEVLEIIGTKDKWEEHLLYFPQIKFSLIKLENHKTCTSVFYPVDDISQSQSLLWDSVLFMCKIRWG